MTYKPRAELFVLLLACLVGMSSCAMPFRTGPFKTGPDMFNSGNEVGQDEKQEPSPKAGAPSRASERDEVIPPTATQEKSSSAPINTSDQTGKQATPEALARSLAEHMSLNSLEVPSWRLPPLESLEKVKSHTAPIAGIYPAIKAAPADPDLAVSLDQKGLVVLWDLEGGRAYHLLSVPEGVEQATLIPELGWIAVSYENKVFIFSIGEAKPLLALKRLGSRVTSLAFQPNGQSLLIGAADGRVYRWRFFLEGSETHKDLQRLFERYMGQTSGINAVVFHPIGRVFFSADWHGDLSSWLTYDSDIFRGRYDENIFRGGVFAEEAQRQSGQRSQVPITKMVVSPDGQFLFAATQEGNIEWWRVRGLDKIGEVKAHRELIYDLTLNPNAGSIASLGRDGKVRVWTLKEPIKDQPENQAFTQALEVPLPDARVLAFASPQRLIAGETTGRVLEVKLP